jgi:outer membrane protein OmpA-like peptidoglycan-associated protein
MQHPAPLIACLLLVAALAPAVAQTTVNPEALERLKPSPQPEVTTHPPAKPAPRARPPAARPPLHPARPGTSVKPPPPPPPPMPVVPLAPPPPPVIPPPIVVPTRPVPPPLPATISPDAVGMASPIDGGLRLTFGADSSDLNPATAAALRSLAHAAPPSASFSVSAYAAGQPDDPSTPRRLSLERALAVRSVLIGEGIASTRIYPKALGAAAATAADTPPDRADIVVSSPSQPKPAP